MGQTSWGVPVSHDQGRYIVDSSTAQGDPFRGPTTGAVPVPLVRVDATREVHRHPNNEDEEGGDGNGIGDGDSITYQTLPSYRERILEAQSQLQASNTDGDGDSDGAPRLLSQADIDAISRRLTEMMKTYIQQNGGNPDALSRRVIVPPRELIDHLVEERLNPREERQ